MKRFMFGAAAVAMSTPAFAADVVQPVMMEDPVYETRSPWSGHIEGYLGGVHLSVEDESDTFWTFGGDARVNYAVNPRWNVQGDLFFDNVDFDIADANFYDYGAAGHVYWRDPSSFALGAFASINGWGGEEFVDDLYSFKVGPEAQLYFDRVTLYGQAYFGQIRSSEASGHLDLWGIRGVVRYFAHENLRFDGELAFDNLEAFGDDLNTFTVAAQANYRFTDTPWTVFGRYQFEDFSVSGESLDFNTHKFIVGLRASFGSEALLEEDRSGATMDVRRSNLTFPLPFL